MLQNCTMVRKNSVNSRENDGFSRHVVVFPAVETFSKPGRTPLRIFPL